MNIVYLTIYSIVDVEYGIIHGIVYSTLYSTIQINGIWDVLRIKKCLILSCFMIDKDHFKSKSTS